MKVNEQVRTYKLFCLMVSFHTEANHKSEMAYCIPTCLLAAIRYETKEGFTTTDQLVNMTRDRERKSSAELGIEAGKGEGGDGRF